MCRLAKVMANTAARRLGEFNHCWETYGQEPAVSAAMDSSTSGRRKKRRCKACQTDGSVRQAALGGGPSGRGRTAATRGQFSGGRRFLSAPISAGGANASLFATASRLELIDRDKVLASKEQTKADTLSATIPVGKELAVVPSGAKKGTGSESTA
jgi:hypothetical protein